MGVIYPVGNGTKEDFNQNWYLADAFGSYREVKNSNGTVVFRYYHSGWDINLISGGNTDLGEKISAIGDGRVDYYHRNSHPTRGYGLHNLHSHKTYDGFSWWLHNAHQMDRDFVAEVKDVKQGDMVGRIGNSGNSYSAHLHHAIFRVDPATLRNGIDTVPLNISELESWWIDPEEFYNKYYGGDMPETIIVEKDDWERARTSLDILEAVHDELGLTGDHVDIGKEPYINEIQAKNNRIAELNGSLDTCNKDKKGLMQELEDCKENNVSPTPGVPDGWSPNGYETTVYSDGKTSITTNYKKD